MEYDMREMRRELAEVLTSYGLRIEDVKLDLGWTDGTHDAGWLQLWVVETGEEE